MMEHILSMQKALGLSSDTQKPLFPMLLASHKLTVCEEASKALSHSNANQSL